MYVYIKSEPNLWTVGFYSPNGNWNPESDYETSEKAAERVHYLNVGKEIENPYILHGEELKRTTGAKMRYWTWQRVSKRRK